MCWMPILFPKEVRGNRRSGWFPSLGTYRNGCSNIIWQEMPIGDQNKWQNLFVPGFSISRVVHWLCCLLVQHYQGLECPPWSSSEQILIKKEPRVQLHVISSKRWSPASKRNYYPFLCISFLESISVSLILFACVCVYKYIYNYILISFSCT